MKNSAAVALGQLGGRARAARRSRKDLHAYAKLAGEAAARVAQEKPEAWRAKSRKGGLERAKRRRSARNKTLPS